MKYFAQRKPFCLGIRLGYTISCALWRDARKTDAVLKDGILNSRGKLGFKTVVFPL